MTICRRPDSKERFVKGGHQTVFYRESGHVDRIARSRLLSDVRTLNFRQEKRVFAKFYMT